MLSKLSLLDSGNQPVEEYNLDELSGRHEGRSSVVTVGGAGSTIEINEAQALEGHLCLEWAARAGAWAVTSHGPVGTVAVNEVPLRDREARMLLMPSCTLSCFGTRMRLERSVAPPEFNGVPCTEIPIPPEGLMIGRKAEARTGVMPKRPVHASDYKPRIDLDPEIFTISSKQAEVARVGRDYVLRNLYDSARYRTKLNGEQGFSERRLVFGDCIQIPDHEYYTFQFNGRALVHIGAGGIIQARGLNRFGSDGTRILAEVDLDLACGDFVGVLGGSGQGKSTLMKAICGMEPANEGAVWIDSRRIEGPGDMAKVGIGYVPQEDIVHRELTVRQALIYAARLRLALSPDLLEEAVDGAIRTLSLAEHQYKPVRVLSGGQIKRVSIASELVMNPRFLFLDEPTSGLDPQTEGELMAELSVLARNKRMGILCTTHVLQNSHLFRTIVWVHGGYIIFAGRPAKAVSYFLVGEQSEAPAAETGGGGKTPAGSSRPSHSSAHHEFDEDELLGKLPKVYGVIGRRVARRGEELKRELPRAGALNPRVLNAAVARELAQSFAKSKIRSELVEVAEGDHTAPAGPRRPGALTTLGVLFARQWRILLADPLNYLFLLAQAVVIGILVGWVSENLVFQMFITVVATLWFGCSNGAQQIVAELPIFRRERLAGVGLNVYLISKVAFQTAITSLQSIILFLAVLTTHHLAHPELLGTETKHDRANELKVYKELFFLNQPQFLKPRANKDEPPPEPTGQPAGPSAEEFQIVEEENAVTPPPQPTTYYSNPTGMHATDLKFAIMERVAWFLRVKENVLDELGVKLEKLAPGETPPAAQTRSWVAFIAVLAGLRITALFAASLCGVALGLLVSASVRTVTQAVMWVPLILIPQILFGGFVVTAPEMGNAVHFFSSLLPSFNLQRLMDTANLYGRTTPRFTNKTKIPAFISPPPYESETTQWNDPKAGELTEKYDKVADVSKSWQNLIVRREMVGERHKEKDPATQLERDIVEWRWDVLFNRGTPYKLTIRAQWSAIILGVWLCACYGFVLINLSKK